MHRFFLTLPLIGLLLITGIVPETLAAKPKNTSSDVSTSGKKQKKHHKHHHHHNENQTSTSQNTQN